METLCVVIWFVLYSVYMQTAWGWPVLSGVHSYLRTVNVYAQTPLHSDVSTACKSCSPTHKHTHSMYGCVTDCSPKLLAQHGQHCSSSMVCPAVVEVVGRTIRTKHVAW